MSFIVAIVPSVNLVSHALPLPLYYNRGYLRPLRCLNAAMALSVYVPIPSYFALLQRILGTINVPTCHCSPFCLSGIPSPPTGFALPQKLQGTINVLKGSYGFFS